MRELLRSGVWDSELAAAFDAAIAGELEDAALAVRLHDSIVMGMFIDPVITAADLPKLDDSEVAETVEAAFGGPATSASFRGDGVGAEVGGDGEGVDGVAVESVGPRGGKPRSVGAGHAARSKRA